MSGEIAIACCCPQKIRPGWYEVSPFYCGKNFKDYGFPYQNNNGIDVKFAARVTQQQLNNVLDEGLDIGGLYFFDGLQMWQVGDFLGEANQLEDIDPSYVKPEWLHVDFIGSPADLESTPPNFIGFYDSPVPGRFSLVRVREEEDLNQPSEFAYFVDIWHLAAFLFLNYQPGLVMNPDGPNYHEPLNLPSSQNNYVWWYNPYYKATKSGYRVEFEGGKVCHNTMTTVIDNFSESYITCNGIKDVPSYSDVVRYADPYSVDYGVGNSKIGSGIFGVDNQYILNPYRHSLVVEVTVFESFRIGAVCPEASRYMPEYGFRIQNGPTAGFESGHMGARSGNFANFINECDGWDPCNECESGATGYAPPGTIIFPSSLNCPNLMQGEGGLCGLFKAEMASSRYLDDTSFVTNEFQPGTRPPEWCPTGSTFNGAISQRIVQEDGTLVEAETFIPGGQSFPLEIGIMPSSVRF